MMQSRKHEDNNLVVEKLDKAFDIVIDNIASDKSISHRCAMFSLLSDQPSTVKNFLRGEDTMDSLRIAQKPRCYYRR